MIKIEKRGFTLLVLCLSLIAFSGCSTGPYTETETVYRDGFKEGSKTVQYDGAGGSRTISQEGVVPSTDISGKEAIEDGLDDPFADRIPGG